MEDNKRLAALGYDRANGNNINISVNETGDRLSVINRKPRKSGKTTLLKTVSGIIKPISGNVILIIRIYLILA